MKFEAKKLLVFLYEKYNGVNTKVYEAINARENVSQEEYDKFYSHYGQAFDQNYVTVLDKDYPEFLKDHAAGDLCIQFMIFPRRIMKFMPLVEEVYKERLGRAK